MPNFVRKTSRRRIEGRRQFVVPTQRAGFGTLTATLGAATLSATGTLAITGTTTQTLAAASLAATGALAIQGVLAVALADVAIVATGASGTTGVLTQTLEDASISATATIVATGGHSHWVGYEPRDLWSNSPRYVRATQKQPRVPALAPVRVDAVAEPSPVIAWLALSGPVDAIGTHGVRHALAEPEAPPAVRMALSGPATGYGSASATATVGVVPDDDDAILWILSVAA